MTPGLRLDGFIDRYSPGIRAPARAVLAKMRRRLPGAVQLVYDNYNALVVGFGPSERASEAIFSVVLYPRWVALAFLHGAKIPDPQRLLRGSGVRVRGLRLEDAAMLDRPAVKALIAGALACSPVPMPRGGRGQLVIKSISRKQRPRRPR